jgi:hypothetical protein
MKRSVRLTGAALAAGLALVITGCQTDATITVNADNSMTMRTVFTIPEDSPYAEGMGGTDGDCTTEQKDGNYVTTCEEEVSAEEAMLSAGDLAEPSGFGLLPSEEGWTLRAWSESGGASMGISMPVTMTVIMPAHIVSAEATGDGVEVSSDGNVATATFDAANSMTFTVEADPNASSGPNLIVAFFAMVAVLFAAWGGVVLYQRRRAKSNEITTDDITADGMTS